MAQELRKSIKAELNNKNTKIFFNFFSYRRENKK